MIKQHLPTTILLSALGLGILGDQLVNTFPWGAGATLWTAAFLAGYVILVRQSEVQRVPDWWIPAVAMACLSVFLLWRDAPELAALDVAMIFACCALLMVHDRPAALSAGSLLEYLMAALASAAHAAAGCFFLLQGRLRTSAEMDSSWKTAAAGVMRGVVLAVPPVIVFGALLAAGDAGFERLVADIFNFDFAEVADHLLVIAFIAWCVAGFLRGRFVASPVRLPDHRRPPALVTGAIEIGMVMGAVDVLFLSFTVLQFHYLFGGAGAIAATPGMTVAQFARRGFFELTTVAALSLPLLLSAEWLMSKERRVVLIFRLLAGLQLLLLFVIMASAMERMLLYQRQFGLTELRVYTSAFMAWLAMVFVWFACTVLRGKRERFAFGSLAAGLFVLSGLHLLNPDDLIARTNISLAREGAPLDTAYLVSLSDDATPALVEALPRLTADEQRIIVEHLLLRENRRKADWRSWNISRERARRLCSSIAAAFPGAAPSQSGAGGSAP